MSEANMDISGYFSLYGSMWFATEVIEESNRGFKWQKVTAKWSGIGPRPLWADESRVFLLNRQPK